MSIKYVLLILCLFSCALVSAQDMAVEELAAAYEKSVVRLLSWDITYTAGHAARWNGWKPISPQRIRWRRSGDVERKDYLEYIDHAGEVVPPYAEFIDGLKLWRLAGDPANAEGIDLLNQKGLHGEICFVNHRSDILLGFPYSSFYFSLRLDKRTLSIPQILREFPTEIVDRKQNGGNIIMTTRSYLPASKEDPKQFVQISFDSSVGCLLKQIVFPLDMEGIPFYAVRDFVEYHSSEDGVFFPIKIHALLTNDINKLEGLEIIGKTAALSITLNQPVEVPPIEFPPGIIVAVEESGTHTAYVWGKDNKPLKAITKADYDAVEKEYASRMGLPPKQDMSLTRKILIATGIILVITVLVLKTLRRR